MVGFMNEEAWGPTEQKRLRHVFSRTRNTL
jgi:phosphoribosyl-AMP cyclohydrolase